MQINTVYMHLMKRVQAVWQRHVASMVFLQNKFTVVLVANVESNKCYHHAQEQLIKTNRIVNCVLIKKSMAA